MTRRKLLSLACLGLMMFAPTLAHGQFKVVAGAFQGWDPPSGTVMMDMGGGIFHATLSGLVPGDFYEFKILEADELPATWDDPQWTATNNWFRADAAGNVTIKLDTNIGTTGENNANVGTSSTNWTPQLVGDFMEAAGGAANWNPADSLFDMVYVSGTQWTKTITISTPGTYSLKLVTNGTFQYQFNNRGFSDLFGEDISFSTTQSNQDVVITFDTFVPSLSIVPQGAVGPAIVGGGIYHAGFAGAGLPPWNAVDTQKQLIQRGQTSQMVSLDNLINSSRGINGIVLDVDGLLDLNDLSFVYTMSPTGAFDQVLFPVSGWQPAPAPLTTALTAGAGSGGSDRILIQWADNAIANRYLGVRVVYDSQTIAEFYVGHLLGETTGPSAGTFTIAFADITNIRADAGQSVDAGSSTDIDKNGTVSFADINAMRANIGAQLTQITIPAQ